jgi:hypothetical protein
MVVAAIRPDSWNFPLLLHVAGAMLLVGSLLLAAVLLTSAARRDEPGATVALTRSGFRTLLLFVLPSYLLMRVGAEWIYSEEGLDDLPEDPDWIGIGYIVSDLGLLLLIIALVVAGLASRRAGRAEPGAEVAGSRAAPIIVLILLAAYSVAVFAMTGKPG